MTNRRSLHDPSFSAVGLLTAGLLICALILASCGDATEIPESAERSSDFDPMAVVELEQVGTTSRRPAGLASLSPDGRRLATLEGEADSLEVCVRSVVDDVEQCTAVAIPNPRSIHWLEEGTTFALVSDDKGGTSEDSAIQTVSSSGESTVLAVPGGLLVPLGSFDGRVLGIMKSEEGVIFGLLSPSNGSVDEIGAFDPSQFSTSLSFNTTLITRGGGDLAVFGQYDGKALKLGTNGQVEPFDSDGPLTNPIAQSDGVLWFRDDVQLAQGILSSGEPLLSYLVVEARTVLPIPDRPGHRHASLSLSPSGEHVVTIESPLSSDGSARLSFATAESVLSGNPTWVSVPLEGPCCGSLDEGFGGVRWVAADEVVVAYADGEIEMLRLI